MIATVDLARIDAAAPSGVAAWSRVAPTDPDGIAAVVDEIAGMVRDDPGVASRVLELLLDLLGPLGALEHEPRALYLLAQARVAEGRLAEALGYIESARLAYVARGDELQALRTNLGRTNVLFELGRHNEALEASVEVLVAFADRRDDLPEDERLYVRGTAHMNAGVCHEYAGRFQAALSSLAAAARDFTELGDGEMLASVLHNRAWVRMALGKVGEAVDDLRRAIELYRDARVRERMVLGQVALVRALVELGEYAQALEVLDAAGDILDEIDAPERRYDYLATSAEAYASLNLLREAVDLYREILKWQADSEFEVERARASFGLGVALCRLDEHDEAALALGDAVATFRTLGHAGWLARSLTAMAETSSGRGDAATACVYLAEAASVADAHGAPAEALQARLALAELGAAVEVVQRNYDEAHALGIAPLIAHAAHAAGRRALDRGDLLEARRYLTEAETIVERQRRSLHHEALLVGFARDKDGLAHDLVQLELADGTSTTARALDAIEGAKSRSLRELAAGTCRRGQDGRHREGSEAIEADLHATYRAMFTAAAEDAAGFDRLRRRAGELESQLQRLRLDGVRSGSATRRQVAEPAALQDGPRELTISYFCLGSEIIAVVGGGAEPVVVPVASVRQVLDLLARLAAQRDRVRLGAAFADRHAARLEQSCRNVLADLYDALIAPLRPHIVDAGPTPRPCLISPHGPLHAVPFHALWSVDHYLADEWSIAVTPSLALASPSAMTDLGAPLVVGVVDELAPLAGDEALAVHAAIGGDLLHGDAATADAFLEAASGRRLVHVATHAWHRGDNPMFSAIRFSDRWLTAAEVLERLDLTGTTVVLSACETGRSSTTGGDELLGLVRGFLGAGAERLVASLWPADDRATAALMLAFHHHLVNESAADALRHAQLQVRTDFPHPTQWAPFVVLGAR